MKKALSYNPLVSLEIKEFLKTNDSYKMPSQWVQRFLIKYRVQAKVSQRAFGANRSKRISIKMGQSNRNDAFLMIPFG